MAFLHTMKATLLVYTGQPCCYKEGILFNNFLFIFVLGEGTASCNICRKLLLKGDLISGTLFNQDCNSSGDNNNKQGNNHAQI